MATKRNRPAEPAKSVRDAKAAPSPRKPRAPARATADPMAAVVAERDSLRLEVAALRSRLEMLASVRAELEARLDSAVSAVQKLLGP